MSGESCDADGYGKDDGAFNPFYAPTMKEAKKLAEGDCGIGFNECVKTQGREKEIEQDSCENSVVKGCHFYVSPEPYQLVCTAYKCIHIGGGEECTYLSDPSTGLMGGGTCVPNSSNNETWECWAKGTHDVGMPNKVYTCTK